MKKLIVVVLVLAAGSVGGYLYWKHQKEQASEAAVPTVATVAVERGSIFQAVASTGRVVSNLDVEIKCRASGQVVKLPFDISDVVHEGDLVLQLDTTEQQRLVSTREVDLTIALAKLAQSRQNLVVAEQTVATARSRAVSLLTASESRARDALSRAERRRQLLAENLGSQEDYDASQTDAASAAAELQNARVAQEEVKTQELALDVRREDIKLAQAQVTSAQIALDLAKQQLSYTTVNSPIEGVVSSLTTQVGAIISSGITNVGGGTTIMVISDLSRVFLLAAVDESDIGSVSLEQPVDISLDAFPGRKFHGKVVRIATKGVNTSNVVTFEVKIEVVDPKKGMLKPEMTGNVQIIAAQRDNVLTVPAAAVSRQQAPAAPAGAPPAGAPNAAMTAAPGSPPSGAPTGQGGESRQRRGGGTLVVTVVNADGTTKEVPVTVGLTDGDKYEITDGLTEGQNVQYQLGEAQGRWNARGGGFPGMGITGMAGRGRR